MAEVVIVENKDAAGALVAQEIAELIQARPDAVLGLATGSTPLAVYQALRTRLAGVDVSRVRGFALDEYVGLDPAHPESYRSVITREVVEPLGLVRRACRDALPPMRLLSSRGVLAQRWSLAAGWVGPRA